MTGNRPFAVSAALATLICLAGPAIADEIKGAAAVKVQDPKRGSIPELIFAYGTAGPTSSAQQTESRSATSSRRETSFWISALHQPQSFNTSRP